MTSLSQAALASCLLAIATPCLADDPAKDAKEAAAAAASQLAKADREMSRQARSAARRG